MKFKNSKPQSHEWMTKAAKQTRSCALESETQTLPFGLLKGVGQLVAMPHCIPGILEANLALITGHSPNNTPTNTDTFNQQVAH